MYILINNLGELQKTIRQKYVLILPATSRNIRRSMIGLRLCISQRVN